MLDLFQGRIIVGLAVWQGLDDLGRGEVALSVPGDEVIDALRNQERQRKAIAAHALNRCSPFQIARPIPRPVGSSSPSTGEMGWHRSREESAPLQPRPEIRKGAPTPGARAPLVSMRFDCRATGVGAARPLSRRQGARDGAPHWLVGGAPSRGVAGRSWPGLEIRHVGNWRAVLLEGNGGVLRSG